MANLVLRNHLSTTIAQSFRYHHNVAKVSKMLQPPHQLQKKGGDPLEKVSQLLLRHGIVQRSSPGMFTLLPLGQRVLNKLQTIVDKEMELIGGLKITLPALTPQQLWVKSGRYKDAGPELFTLMDRKEVPFVLCPTHEESICSLVANMQLSPNNLPLRLYQMTSKFRDEARCRHAMLRSKEFLMKDLYSFDTDEAFAGETYESVTRAYHNIFKKIGVPYVRAQGSVGTVGGKYSHEYHYLSKAGQDTLLHCLGDCGTVLSADLVLNTTEDMTNEEIEENLSQQKCSACHGNMTTSTAIEVGHTFLLGDKYSKPLKANYIGSNNKKIPLVMGCYGLGLTRILQATVEATFSDTSDRIVWPLHLAPYKLCIIGPKRGSKEEKAAGFWVENLVSAITSTVPQLNHEIIVDDRSEQSIGARLRDAKNTGYPHVIVIGKKSMDSIPKFELINNANHSLGDCKESSESNVDETEVLTQLELLNKLNNLF